MLRTFQELSLVPHLNFHWNHWKYFIKQLTVVLYWSIVHSNNTFSGKLEDANEEQFISYSKHNKLDDELQHTW